MAIKIDLLPGYVRLRRVLKWTALISFVIVTSVGSVLYVLYYQKTLELETVKENVQMWTPVAAQATAVEAEANTKNASLGNKEATVKFFADATQTGPRRAVAVDLIRRYIMPDALVSSIDISDGKNVTIVASVVDSDSYGRLLLNLRKGTVGTPPPPAIPYVWQQTPMASGIPGYPLPSAPTPNLDSTTPTAITFPLAISLAGPLRDDLVFSTPMAPGETDAAPAGAPGAPGGSSGP